MKMQTFGAQKDHQVIFPNIPADVALPVVFQVVGYRSHDQKMQHGSGQVTCYLYIHTKLEEPVRIEEDTNDEYTKCLEKMKGVKDYVSMGSI